MIRDLLIGKTAIIQNKTNETIVEGLITDETHHTLTVNDKCVVKSTVFVTINGTRIDGKSIDMRPVDRIKARFKTKKEQRI